MVLWAVLETNSDDPFLPSPTTAKFTSSFESLSMQACFKVIHYGRATHSRSH